MTGVVGKFGTICRDSYPSTIPQGNGCKEGGIMPLVYSWIYATHLFVSHCKLQYVLQHEHTLSSLRDHKTCNFIHQSCPVIYTLIELLPMILSASLGTSSMK